MLAVSIAVDVLLVLIFLLIAIFFTKHGLDGALNLLGKAWLAVAFALIIGPLITNFLEDLFITQAINNAVYNSLSDLIAHNANGYDLSQLFASLPANFVSLLDGMGASLSALEAEFGTYTEASADIIRTMAARIAEPCVLAISSILGYVLGIIIPWAILKWLAYEVKKDQKHKFFAFFDRLGGFFVGIALGYAAVVGLAIVTRTVFQVVVAFDASIPVLSVYDSSYVFRFLAEFDTVGTISSIFDALSNSLRGFIR